MDPIKAAVASEVQGILNEHVGDQIAIVLNESHATHNFTVEVSDTTETLTTIRVVPPKGGPRYFIVKVSEQI